MASSEARLTRRPSEAGNSREGMKGAVGREEPNSRAECEIRD